MRRTIKFEPGFQHVAILFNSNADIISLASTLNKLTHSALTLTGALKSRDSILDKELEFIAFSHEDKIAKATMFLIKNKTEFKIQKKAYDLFSEEQEEIIHRQLIGSSNSIYTHKSLINSDYCIILSFPFCQHKPQNIISGIKKHPQIASFIEIDFENYSNLKDLSEEIEIYITEYNVSCEQKACALKRSKILSKREKEEVKEEVKSNRIYYGEF